MATTISHEEQKAYFASEAISRSDLVALRRGPRYYKYWHKHKKQTKAMLNGSQFHHLVLEPDQFDKLYTVAPEGIKLNTVKGKALAKEAEESGKSIIKFLEYEALQEMANSVLAHSAISSIMASNNKLVETSFYSTIDSIPIKCRPDLIDLDTKTIVDIKTTRSLSTRKLQYSIRDLGYDLQAAIYLTLVMDHYAEPFTFLNVWVEKSAPYDVRVTRFDSMDLHRSREELKALIHLMKTCNEAEQWPSLYPQEIETLYVGMIEAEDNTLEEENQYDQYPA